MAQPKFISYQETETWTSYLLDQLFLIWEPALTNWQNLCTLWVSLYTQSRVLKISQKKMHNVNVPHRFNIYHSTWNPYLQVPLEETIKVALDRTYHRKEIETSFSKNDMRNLLLLCTKNVHFCFGGDIYQKNDGVAIDFPLGPVLAGTCMVELETRIIPTASGNISF